MRPLFISAPIILLTLFLGGCWHGPATPPPPADGSGTQNQSTTTVDNNGTQYPPDASVEGKTELRYTADGKKIYNNPALGLYFEYPKDYVSKDDDIERSIQDGIYIVTLIEANKQTPKVIYTNTVTGVIRVILNKADYSLDGGRSKEYLSGDKLDFNGGIAAQLQERSLSVYEIIDRKSDRVIVHLNTYDHADKGLELTGYMQNQNALLPNLAISTYLGNYFEANRDDWADAKLPPKKNIEPAQFIKQVKSSRSYRELFNIFYSIKF